MVSPVKMEIVVFLNFESTNNEMTFSLSALRSVELKAQTNLEIT